MEHCFASVKNNEAFFNEDTIHHLVNVKRAKLNQHIEISDAGDLYEAEIISLSPFEVKILREITDRDREQKIDVTCAFSLLKGGHDELVLQKCTELGVKKFIPLFSERTIIKLAKGKDQDKRHARYEKILVNSCEQCKRNLCPELDNFMTLKEVFSLEGYDYKIFAFEGEAFETGTLKNTLKDLKEGDKVLYVIGPEGGFSPEEVQLAHDKGFSFVSLGKRILRAETASIYMASILSFFDENLD